MKAERETKGKLIASAKAEFMEKGYAKTSLRKICANAGVTTGALYFFFEDKEDLFRAIVEPPLTALTNMMQEHFTRDEQILSLPDVYEHQEGDHDEIAEMLIHHLYQNYDAFILPADTCERGTGGSRADESNHGFYCKRICGNEMELI